ncbi:MAG: hypothetical protein NTX50_04760 [Candidatus Sumerlaeota bacterium]|nr:hypothetical protein [Candidatus Sumerlaeota bacterium]
MTVKFRVYADTSVIGGCLDEEFAKESLALLEMAKQGEVFLVVSAHLADELLAAPDEVKAIFDSLPDHCLERVPITEEVLALHECYMQAEILGPACSDDALHVAIATVARVDLIVSWNFRHIVHFDKIRRFNAINLFQGYPTMDIRSPKEVV